MTTSPPKKTTYADAGVDIDAGNALVQRIKPNVVRTKRSGVMGNIGGFGGLFDLKAAGYDDAVLVAATDGVGTKLKLAHEADQHDTIGIDLVAMCVNDLLAQGAEPLFFLDYYACGALSVDVAAQVVEGIAHGCMEAGCALIGGETAEMPGMYQVGDYDLAGFVVGAVSRDAMLPRMQHMQAGDVLLGLASSGVHSNGYSLVRRLLEKHNVSYHDNAPWDSEQSVVNSLLTPTRIYVKSCLAAIKTYDGVKGIAHITGGGLTENIPRILPDGLRAVVDVTRWSWPAMFSWMQDAGSLDDADMLKTFNCGIGLVLVVQKEQCDDVAALLEQSGERVMRIGTLEEANGAPYVEYQSL